MLPLSETSLLNLVLQDGPVINETFDYILRMHSSVIQI